MMKTMKTEEDDESTYLKVLALCRIPFAYCLQDEHTHTHIHTHHNIFLNKRISPFFRKEHQLNITFCVFEKTYLDLKHENAIHKKLLLIIFYVGKI